jgi:hypothetical protein
MTKDDRVKFLEQAIKKIDQVQKYYEKNMNMGRIIQLEEIKERTERVLGFILGNE